MYTSKTAYGTFVIMVLSANVVLAQDAMVNDIRSVPAESLAAARTDNNWQLPRTSWGHPDIQGIWTSDDMRGVPTNRPQEFGERTSLTAEEFAQRANRDQAGMDRAVNDETFLRNEYGIRTFGYTSLVIDPSNGRIPEMTEIGKSRAAPRDQGTFGSGPFNTVEDFTNYDRCISRGIVGSVLPVLYGNGMRILQTPNSVVISYEMIHDTRIIPIDDSPFPDDAIRQYLGSSRGYWDGDTLVIETRNLTDKTSIGGNGNGIRHSEEMVMTERMTRVDHEMVDYIITVNDPVTYTAPFSFRFTITSQPGYQLYEYSCHEGNGAVGHTLSGERAWERQVAEAMANGETVPERAGGFSIYATPQEGADIIQIGEEDAVD